MPPQGQAPPRVLRNLRVRRVQLTSRSGVLKEARSRIKPGENARREGGLAGQLQALSSKLQGKATPFATDQHGLGEEGTTNYPIRSAETGAEPRQTWRKCKEGGGT